MSRSRTADDGPLAAHHPGRTSLGADTGVIGAARGDPDDATVCPFHRFRLLHLPVPSIVRRADAGRKPLGMASVMAPWIRIRLTARQRAGLTNGRSAGRQPPAHRVLERHGSRGCVALADSVDGHACFGPSRFVRFRQQPCSAIRQCAGGSAGTWLPGCPARRRRLRDHPRRLRRLRRPLRRLHQ